ncbi:unnamed protein product [Rotaria sp. Silwood1]|nr:unnamed protein product [Rotaria sp. Silwood1]CAF1184085.1 unnamed protein product [Rotaria sp. Silwood1]CAF3452877.1 unnamed protein product [Rotaria sp. Silwood1]CAF4929427.1 unnamed protein product [Rotaria sp. Silwood1]
MPSSQPKSRIPLTARQRSILLDFYNRNPYPSASERYLLVQLTGRTIKQVQDWFSNRRVYTSFLILISFPIRICFFSALILD